MDAAVEERMVVVKKKGMERSICHGRTRADNGREVEQREGNDDKGVDGV